MTISSSNPNSRAFHIPYHNSILTITPIGATIRFSLNYQHGWNYFVLQTIPNPNPKTSVLLVIDMQNHFSSIAKPIIPSITSTIQTCREASIPIIFTRHCHKSQADHGMLGEWWNDLIIDGTDESELMNDMGRRKEDMVVHKHTYSGFRGTGLEELLKEMGVEEVIITGVMTNLCCETTAREAFVRGFRVFFSTDGTATSDEGLHEATLMNMAYGFAYLVDSNSLKHALTKYV